MPSSENPQREQPWKASWQQKAEAVPEYLDNQTNQITTFKKGEEIIMGGGVLKCENVIHYDSGKEHQAPNV